jgi:hypothetical protein
MSGYLLWVSVQYKIRNIMAKIEIRSFFFDLLHCKDKIISIFDGFDEKYGDDERGSLVAGIREMGDADLVNLLINVQRMATGYEEIKELMDAAEEEELQKTLEEDDDDDDYDDDDDDDDDEK